MEMPAASSAWHEATCAGPLAATAAERPQKEIPRNRVGQRNRGGGATKADWLFAVSCSSPPPPRSVPFAPDEGHQLQAAPKGSSSPGSVALPVLCCEASWTGAGREPEMDASMRLRSSATGEAEGSRVQARGRWPQSICSACELHARLSSLRPPAVPSKSC
ncbi:hypothetical protein GN956_G18968 [Arapaima gigas]